MCITLPHIPAAKLPEKYPGVAQAAVIVPSRKEYQKASVSHIGWVDSRGGIVDFDNPGKWEIGTGRQVRAFLKDFFVADTRIITRWVEIHPEGMPDVEKLLACFRINEMVGQVQHNPHIRYLMVNGLIREGEIYARKTQQHFVGVFLLNESGCEIYQHGQRVSLGLGYSENEKHS